MIVDPKDQDQEERKIEHTLISAQKIEDRKIEHDLCCPICFENQQDAFFKTACPICFENQQDAFFKTACPICRTNLTDYSQPKPYPTVPTKEQMEARNLVRDYFDPSNPMNNLLIMVSAVNFLLVSDGSSMLQHA
jgi:hypothetical protein